MQAVQVRLLNKGYYTTISDSVVFPLVVEGSIDKDGDVYISGLELHKIDPSAFDKDNFQYFFDNDYEFFEVVS